MSTLEIKIDDKNFNQTLLKLVKNLTNSAPLFRDIADILLFETEQNFAEQGRPKWPDLAESTQKRRLAKNKGSNLLQILQDSGLLASSITPSHGKNFARISTNVPYAPAMQLGAIIQHPARTTKTRLAVNKDGSLKRQRSNRNLAVFARSEAKARTSITQSQPYTVKIPAREFMPFTGDPENPQLQPQTQEQIVSLMSDLLSGKKRY